MNYERCIDFIKEPGLTLVTVSDVESRRLNPKYVIPKRKIITADSTGIIMENDGGELIFLPHSSVYMIGRFNEGT